MRSVLFVFILVCTCFSIQGQGKRIQILHSDNSTIDEVAYPGATVLIGNVFIRHEGITLKCKKAIHYKNENYIKAFGNVVLNQGDSIRQTSQYTEYNGNTKKALSWGRVMLKDPQMTLRTDTLQFDREKQLLYYRYSATIQDSINTLTSDTGNYYLSLNKFQAISDVVLTNPDYVLNSNHLDYYTDSGKAFLYGESTIRSDDNLIFCKKGFYDTKTDVSYFTRDARIEFDNKEIKADSLYYNRNLGFASANENIVIIDTLNNSVLKGNYAEFFEKVDSAFVVGRAVAITNTHKDSLFIHGDTILATGVPEERIIRCYHHVKFFKSDLSGKCDSIHSNQGTGLTQMFVNPILWSDGSQITGDTIQLINDTEEDRLDSLKVLYNAFIINKDSMGYNQIKGRNLFGKFEDNDLRFVNVVGNGEIIHYVRDEAQELIGIEKTSCSEIHFLLRESKIEQARFINQPDGQTYPPSKLPKNARKLRGFNWRESEQPRSKEDIFIKDD